MGCSCLFFLLICISRKGFDTFVLPTCWLTRKDHNTGIFYNAMRHEAELASWIREEGPS
jgi:hypothetical protein